MKRIVSLILIIALAVTNMSMHYTHAEENATKKIYRDDNIEVTFNIVSRWDGAYNADITVKNIGNKKIENWYMLFELNESIDNIWNAEVQEKTEQGYIVKNSGWNQDIKVGECVQFGFTAKGDFTSFPEQYSILGDIVDISLENVDVEYYVDSDWDNGFNGNITIYNKQDKEIEDWILEFDFENEITSVWNANIVYHNNNHYIISCPDWNQTISVDEDVSFGFTVENGNSEKMVTSIKLSENKVIDNKVVEEPYKLVDTDGDGLYDEHEKELKTDINKIDTDGDGLTDYQEVFITYTDPLVVDSKEKGIFDYDADNDEDGIVNGEEIKIGTNPCKKDTDKDEISDGTEIQKETDPMKKDTDEDGVEDNDELEMGLNPLIKDTDGNGILDGEEFIKQLIKRERYQESVFDNNDLIPNITIETKGNINKKINVYEYTGDMYGDERSYVGKPIDIRGCDFEKGNIEFQVTESFFMNNYEYEEQNTNGLVICYNDGEETTPLKTSYDDEKTTLKAEMKGAGIYFVIDVFDWAESWNIDVPVKKSTVYNPVNDTPIPETPRLEFAAPMEIALKSSTVISSVKVSGQVDIVFIVDTTGSMSTYITNVKNNLMSFVNDIQAANISPSFALVEYRDITCDGDNSTKINKNGSGTNWFRNVNEFKSAISNLDVGGGGDLPETLVDALAMASELDMRESAQKFFIVVTDADYKEENNFGIDSMDEMISILKEKSINVSVVSENEYTSVYNSLYNSTGGVFANVSYNFKDELLKIAEKIDEDTNDGSWIALNGLIPKIVKLDEKPSIISNADTDRDRLLDNQELKSTVPTKIIDVDTFVRSIIELPEEIELPKIAVYDYNSNPAKKDTDNDGLDDLLDNEPRNYLKHSFLIYETEKTDYDLKEMELEDRPSDFKYADKRKSELKDMEWINWSDFFLLSKRDYEYSMKDLMRTFSMGDMQDVALDMVDSFLEGSGEDYQNDTLSEEVAEHDNTKKYVDGISEIIEQHIGYYNGDISGLKYNASDRKTSEMVVKMNQNEINMPFYNDKLSGLGITVDGLYGNRVEVTKYEQEGNYYKCSIHFTMYDIFGLDDGDITDSYMTFAPPFGILAGFRSWYILQHWDKYDGEVKPFITYMEFDKEIEGIIR